MHIVSSLSQRRQQNLHSVQWLSMLGVYPKYHVVGVLKIALLSNVAAKIMHCVEAHPRYKFDSIQMQVFFIIMPD